MSVMRRILNRWLRLVEKRRLRVASPKMIRRALEVQSRLFFYAPRGTKSRWVDHNRIPCLEIAPRSVQPGRVLLYFHGGGFVLVVLILIQQWLRSWRCALARVL